MKRFPYLLMFMALLVACNDGGTPTCVGPDGTCDGYGDMKPDQNRFIDPIGNSNKKINMMIALGNTQISAYVQNKLRGFSGDTTGLDMGEIARTALAIADGNQNLDASDGVIDAAMYVVSSDLFTSCGDTGDITSCIDKWRTDNASVLASRLTELRARADALDIGSVHFNTTTDGTDYVQFSLDADGKITGISTRDATYARVGDSTFSDGTSTLTYKSAVMDADTGLPGLSYSDFGVYQIQTGDEITRNIPFAGGYDQKRIATTDIGTDLEFSGVAVGTVSNATDNLDVRDDRASLTFNHETGDSTLTATFANWYKITVNQNIDATDTNIGFSNYQGTDEFKLPDGVDNAPANMNIGYYGANPSTGTPSEATGLVQYKNDASGINMDVAFGARK